MSRTDEITRADLARLKGLIEAQLAGRVRCLCLRLDEKGLVLRGLSRTYHAKQIAQHIVMKACRHPILANEIEVKPLSSFPSPAHEVEPEGGIADSGSAS
jgi:hypothetical protein